MTISEAIVRTDSLKPNAYGNTEKIEWLSRLDGMVKRLIIDKHEGSEDVIFSGYDVDTDTDTQLLVSEPFDDIYLRWLEAQIDYANAEYRKYNNTIMQFNSAYEAFAGYYTRTHMPVAEGKRFIF